MEEVLNSFNIEPTHGDLSTSINEIVPVSESLVAVSVNSGNISAKIFKKAGINSIISRWFCD